MFVFNDRFVLGLRLGLSEPSIYRLGWVTQTQMKGDHIDDESGRKLQPYTPLDSMICKSKAT